GLSQLKNIRITQIYTALFNRDIRFFSLNLSQFRASQLTEICDAIEYVVLLKHLEELSLCIDSQEQKETMGSYSSLLRSTRKLILCMHKLKVLNLNLLIPNNFDNNLLKSALAAFENLFELNSLV